MANDEQSAVWNDVVGDAWVKHVEAFDATLAPFGSALVGCLGLAEGDRVLDVGCGVGSTVLDLAARVAPGEVVGVDISSRMLDEARRRVAAAGLTNVRLIDADVQSADLGNGVFDVAFSRFGVMFFSDPQAAFSNIASSLTAGGRLGFVCFGSPANNPFLTVPILAASGLLGVSPPGPGEPSPFSLADAERIFALLTAAGFADVRIEPGPATAELHGASTIDVLAERLLEQNPTTGVRMAVVDASTRLAAIHAAAQALEEHRNGDVVRLGAATWLVTAGKPR